MILSIIMKKENNHNLPCLTKEEFEFFRIKDESLFKRYSVNWTLRRKIASSLQELAVKKLLGFGGFDKNKKGAIKHHLKACKYDRSIINHSSFREYIGL